MRYMRGKLKDLTFSRFVVGPWYVVLCLQIKLKGHKLLTRSRHTYRCPVSSITSLQPQSLYRRHRLVWRGRAPLVRAKMTRPGVRLHRIQSCTFHKRCDRLKRGPIVSSDRSIFRLYLYRTYFFHVRTCRR